MYPSGDFRNSTIGELRKIKSDVMVNWIRLEQEKRLWTTGGNDEGVVLKVSPGEYTSSPSRLRDEPDGFFHAIETMKVKVAMTLHARFIKILLHNNQMPWIEIKAGKQLQVLPNIASLQRCKKHHFAAFIADRELLVVWDDDPQHVLDRAAELENDIIEMIWGNDSIYPDENEKKEAAIDVAEVIDSTESQTAEPKRRTVMIQPVLTACTLILTICAIGTGWRWIAIETFVDRTYLRIAFVGVALPQMWLALFFFQSLVTNVAQFIGPIGQVMSNTKFYSAKPSPRLRRAHGEYPHLTIQCPVYKEGLRGVIEPTIKSIKAAISTYEMQGGTANIFVNDDGMQLLSEEEAKARQEFYDEHNIGWVARPKHNPKPNDGSQPFHRRGKFKKASNMNYALWVSNRVEEKLNRIQRHDVWTTDDELAAYNDALADVIAEDEGRTWAEGDIRIGDYILLIDSDTRVPKDCFLDAVSEMEHSPEVAIVQYSSGVMNVTDSFFEGGVTFFTNLVYTQIKYAVANGDVAPFVGHNAVLRWSAMQEIAYDCELDNREKYWSEQTVSEDFDMALRLQTSGYILRLAAYMGDGYQEGVSLTVYDELMRWEKYAYGCSELVFHPLKYWLIKGPLTPLFRRFIMSNMPLPSKFTIMAYVGTYYALGSAWILSLLNYFMAGWFNGYLDNYYVDSFQIYFSIIVVFIAMGKVALAVLRYRTEEKTLISGLIENFKWVPLLMIFLGGVSLHISQAILSHLFGIDMSWGATAKEKEDVTFFEEIPRVLKKFKFTFLFCIACGAMMPIMVYVVPVLWRIKLFIAIWPLSSLIVCHFFLPIALNPNLMLFTW
ncbi:glycosyl transferase family group 2-domain-containing protein [Lineolata rhizophorae]|uniref:Glycosyl transferase family group 2-domain-containing protein n=1 Tax=Lineolata rhizophorae TaxID=578093 RepID=A0A6A6P5V6_9PEZI|nr:glycosyl transferase family group 2-domain-containing protein [Lineolata rhizophorae]